MPFVDWQVIRQRQRERAREITDTQFSAKTEGGGGGRERVGLECLERMIRQFSVCPDGISVLLTLPEFARCTNMVCAESPKNY